MKNIKRNKKDSIPVKQQHLISPFPSLFLRQIPTASPASITPSISLHKTDRQIGPLVGIWLDQGCILSPCLFNLYAEYIMRNAGLEEAQAGIKSAGRNINHLR